MGNRLQTMGWDFDEEELCFNCRAEAVQSIKVTDEELITLCTNCGAEAHYALYCSCDEPIKARLTPPCSSEFGTWRFTREARCPRCWAEAPNEIAVDASGGIIVCQKCSFTRLYRFDMFNKRWR
jgi:transcription elongation factor Elf1